MPKWKTRKNITKGKIMSELKKNSITNTSKKRERKANMMGRKVRKGIKKCSRILKYIGNIIAGLNT